MIQSDAGFVVNSHRSSALIDGVLEDAPPCSIFCQLFTFFRLKYVKTCFQSLHKNAISRLVFFPFLVNFSFNATVYSSL